MSLRLRLVLSIGGALLVLWALAAAWMLRGLDRNLQQTLDDRLAMSASMVAGLLAQGELPTGGASAMSTPDALAVPGGRGMACRIRSLRGDVVAATAGAPAALDAAATAGYRTRSIDGEQWRTYTLVAGGMQVTTGDRLEERGLLQRQVLVASGVPFLIASLGGLLVLWYGTARGLAPLERMRRALSARAPDALAPLELEPLPAELRPFGGALDALLRRTSDAVRRERRFTDDAAHELRTPLTAISTHLQVAAMSEGEGLREALADAGEGVRRLQATLDQLLLLARVEGRLPFEEADAIDAPEAVRRAIAVTGAAAGRVRCRTTDAGPLLALPAELAVVAVRNLLDNALRYSPADAPVDVGLAATAATVEVRVRDRGPGLGADGHRRARERFWRGGPGEGSGLGLTIVDAIAQRYGGAFELREAGDGGTEAVLRLPRLDAAGQAR